ncbi:hypothetical protein T4D_10849 [Trichinella pseudospiralis]|uniref:Secreted protein n=1 Tax=Trichinella pseudospiralis TaxID=6337 RepID=A0A0V1FNM0_TRIPS|nr:hypothetical protein T4D_10849 [Trichinella pseudospiralis]
MVPWAAVSLSAQLCFTVQIIVQTNLRLQFPFTSSVALSNTQSIKSLFLFCNTVLNTLHFYNNRNYRRYLARFCLWFNLLVLVAEKCTQYQDLSIYLHALLFAGCFRLTALLSNWRDVSLHTLCMGMCNMRAFVRGSVKLYRIRCLVKRLSIVCLLGKRTHLHIFADKA